MFLPYFFFVENFIFDHRPVMLQSWRPPVRTATASTPSTIRGGPRRVPGTPLAVTAAMHIPSLNFPQRITTRVFPGSAEGNADLPPDALLLFCIGDMLHAVFRLSVGECRNGRQVYISCKGKKSARSVEVKVSTGLSLLVFFFLKIFLGGRQTMPQAALQICSLALLRSLAPRRSLAPPPPPLPIPSSL